jgi:hypothetical protein
VDRLVGFLPLAAGIAIAADLAAGVIDSLVSHGAVARGPAIFVLHNAAIALSFLALCVVVIGLWRFASPPTPRATAVTLVGITGAIAIVVADVIATALYARGSFIDTTPLIRIAQDAVGLWLIGMNLELKERRLLTPNGTTGGIVVGIATVVVSLSLSFGFATVAELVGLVAGVGYFLWLSWLALGRRRLFTA